MKKDTILTLFFYTCITLFFFGMLIKMGYATDTYQVFNWNGEQVYSQFASSGRFVTAIVGKIVKDINLSEQLIYVGSFILAIIFTILSQFKLNLIIEKDIKSHALQLILPTLIIINPFSIELFLFIENGIMLFGILMCIWALENVIRYFDKHKLKKIIYAIIDMLIANCCYQGIVGLFISISLVYILKYSKNIKEFVKNNCIVGFIYGFPAIINYLMTKILTNGNRLTGKINIIESTEKILRNSENMILNSYGILPKNLFILAILFTLLCFCSKIWKDRKKFLNIIYIICGTTLAALLPQFLQPTQSIWLVPRSTYCFASLYGIIILYLCINYSINKNTNIAILAISIFMLIFQANKFIQIENDRYKLNMEDLSITSQIAQMIEQDEKTTGNTINNIEFYQDTSPNYTYNGIFATGDINVKCYANGWSTVAILNYYLNRNFTLIEGNRKIEKNWDKFSKEQIIFEGENLIIYNY